MKKININKLKSSKGSASLLVAITIFTFIAVLMGGYLTISILRQSQYESNIRIQEIYGKDVDNIEKVYDDVIETMKSWNKEKQVNVPKLLTGMTPIKFNMPTEEKMGETVTTTEVDEEWFEYGTTYETKKWANAQTEDGSMWVWIPRFAYKINSEEETTDVVFLIGTTDFYYDENGEMQKAQRCRDKDQFIETDSTKTDKYTVHPAFTDESSINFRNGGWDDELTGIWVAKFEAGYASGNNEAPVVASEVNYSKNTVWAQATETGASDASLSARNWLDGVYGDEKMPIKYPTFQGTTYSMNYINHNDAFNIAKKLTGANNIYGLNNLNADSHLMKDSEWGAVAYLRASQYGLNKTEMKKNNINLNSGGSSTTKADGNAYASLYAVTGCTSNSTTAESKTTIATINDVTTANTNGIYVWNQKIGQNASTTGTIYGIYDLSGGLSERTSSFISNGYINLLNHGKSLLDETNVTYNTVVTANTGNNTKYATIYQNDESEETNINTASQKNFAKNTKIYGDAIRETNNGNAGTSNSGWNISSWKNNCSKFIALYEPFLIRGGQFISISNGSFRFERDFGDNDYKVGFRAVLVSI